MTTTAPTHEVAALPREHLSAPVRVVRANLIRAVRDVWSWSRSRGLRRRRRGEAADQFTMLLRLDGDQRLVLETGEGKGDHGASAWLACEVGGESPPTVWLTGRRLAERLTALDGDFVELSWSGHRMRMYGDSARFDVPITPRELGSAVRKRKPDPTEIEKPDPDQWVPILPESVTVSELRHALTLCCQVVSREDIRYGLNGVRLEAHERGVKLLATDGHRLVRVDLGEPAPDEFDYPGGNLGIDWQAAAVLRDLLRRHSRVELQRGNGARWRLVTEAVEVWGVWDAQFPDVRGAGILRGQKAAYSFDRARMRAALRRAALVHDRGGRGALRLDVVAGGLMLKREAFETSYCEIVPCEFGEQPVDGPLGMNTDFMEWVVKTVRGKRIEWRTTGKALGPTSVVDGNVVMVIMPMRLD